MPSKSNIVPGRYWIVSDKIVIASSAASAKRFAKLRGVKGALSSLTARLAPPEEISRFISEEPERVAANDKARAEFEARERLNAAAPGLLAALNRVEVLLGLEFEARGKIQMGIKREKVLSLELNEAREVVRAAIAAAS